MHEYADGGSQAQNLTLPACFAAEKRAEDAWKLRDCFHLVPESLSTGGTFCITAYQKRRNDRVGLLHCIESKELRLHRCNDSPHSRNASYCETAASGPVMPAKRVGSRIFRQKQILQIFLYTRIIQVPRLHSSQFTCGKDALAMP